MQKNQNNIGLIWFKNDLRTQDNAVLAHAIKEHTHVIAVYCLDPRLFTTTRYGIIKTDKYRAKFLLETLQELKLNLEQLNIDLLVYYQKPEVSIPELCKNLNISSIYLQREWTKEELDILNLTKKACGPTIKFSELYNQFLFHPNSINFDIKETPKVFTVFRKKLEKHINVSFPINSSPVKNNFRIKNKTNIPTLKDLGFKDFNLHAKNAFPFKGGENQALQRVNDYFFKTKKLAYYKKTRNGLLGVDYSSKLSAWLANGSISAKTIYHKVLEFETLHTKNQSTYWLIFELIWRDFFKYTALKHSNDIFKIKGILNIQYQWSNDTNLVNTWIDGKTNSDFVNANMLELKNTGWMSNRGRQNVASYFSKELKLDWRIGAAYFESLLIDYDVHSNYGNWQYLSGVGNDPRDRKFNVKLQADRYDTDFKYRKTWLQTELFSNRN